MVQVPRIETLGIVHRLQGELAHTASPLSEVASARGGCSVELAGSRPGSGTLGESSEEEESDIEEAVLLHRRAAASPAPLAVRGPSGASKACEGAAAEAFETAVDGSGCGAASPQSTSPRGALPAAGQAEEEGDAAAPEGMAAGAIHIRPAAVALEMALAMPGLEPLEGECPSGSNTSRLSAAQLEARLQEAAAAQLASMAAAALEEAAAAVAVAGQQFSSQQGPGAAEEGPGCGEPTGQLGATWPHQFGQDCVESPAGASVGDELAAAAAAEETLQEAPAGDALVAALPAGTAAAEEQSATSREELAAGLEGGEMSTQELAAELEGVAMQQLASLAVGELC